MAAITHNREVIARYRARSNTPGAMNSELLLFRDPDARIIQRATEAHMMTTSRQARKKSRLYKIEFLLDVP